MFTRSLLRHGIERNVLCHIAGMIHQHYSRAQGNGRSSADSKIRIALALTIVIAYAVSLVAWAIVKLWM